MRYNGPDDQPEYHPYDPNYVDPNAPKKKSLLPIWIALGVAVVIFALCGGILATFSGSSPEAKRPAISDLGSSPRPTGVPDTGTRPVAEPPVSPKPVPAPKAKTKPVGVSDGTWIVGEDLDAGAYRSPGAEEGMFQFCAWNVRKTDDPESDIVDFGSSSKTSDPQRAKLKRGNMFETSGCGTWTKK